MAHLRARLAQGIFLAEICGSLPTRAHVPLARALVDGRRRLQEVVCYTTDGDECLSDCEGEGEDYAWCWTEFSWG